MKDNEIKGLNINQIRNRMEKLRLERNHARITVAQKNEALGNVMLELDTTRKNFAKVQLENMELRMIINECFTSDRDDMQLRKGSFVHHTVNHIYFYKSCKQSMGIVIKMIEKYLTT